MALPNLDNPTDVPGAAVIHRARRLRPARPDRGRRDEIPRNGYDPSNARSAGRNARDQVTTSSSIVDSSASRPSPGVVVQLPADAATATALDELAGRRPGQLRAVAG
ncbi:hypothetical protein ABZU25_08995 [Micromonospora sp. NPDC005215]|uniref:hypothetical protein n=1 Tax=Micromonospora sp. NPDC005215 TaxID=3157024 RepID=UPI0033A36C56